MPTLILSPRHTDGSQALWRTAIALADKGWDVVRMTKFHEIIGDFAEPVPYGEPIFNQVVADRFNLDLPKPSDRFLPDLPFNLRKRYVELMTVGEARQGNEPAFIKPPNDKMFPAKVYQKGSELPEDLPDDEPALVQEVVEWESEFRFFMIDGVSCTGSNYMDRGKYTKDTDYACDLRESLRVDEFSQHLSEAGLPHAVVVDIGIIKGRGPAVIEANDVCSSGIYGCNPERVLDCLYYAAHRKRIPRPELE